MKIKNTFVTSSASVALIAALLVGCNSPEKESAAQDVSQGTEQTTEPMTAVGTETAATVKGVPGGVKSRTIQLAATVKAIDYENRSVTLIGDNGGEKTLAIGPDAINFEQVKTGDRVNIAYMEELVIYLKEIGEPSGNGVEGLAARAPEGNKPAGIIAGTAELTATVTAVDLANHTATLQFPGGDSQVVTVRDDIELSEDQVGREVVFQSTQAVAISVESPEEATN